MDNVNTLQTITSKPWVVPTLVGVASGGVGFLAGWFLSSRYTREEIVTIEAQDEVVVTMDEIRERRNNGTAKRLVEEIQGRTEAVESVEDGDVEADAERQGFVIDADAYKSIVLNEQGDPSKIVVAPPREPEVESIWDGVDTDIPGWDWDEEKMKREKAQIYILHRDEFFNNESEYSQSTLTYYAGDDKLTDEKDVPLYNAGDVVGSCLSWGHGSGDPNVVYIRNDILHAEYEVLLHANSYESEVLGIEAEREIERELRHSKHQLHKFRPE